MKKELLKVIIAIGICLVVVVGVIIGFNVYVTWVAKQSEAKNYSASCEKYGYVEYWDDKYPEENVTILIKTYEDYVRQKESVLDGGDVAEWYKEKLESYDKKFFEENDLIIDHYFMASGDIDIKFERLCVKDGVADIKVKITTPDNRSDDMAYWAVFVEVSKENGIVSVE